MGPAGSAPALEDSTQAAEVPPWEERCFPGIPQDPGDRADLPITPAGLHAASLLSSSRCPRPRRFLSEPLAGPSQGPALGAQLAPISFLDICCWVPMVPSWELAAQISRPLHTSCSVTPGVRPLGVPDALTAAFQGAFCSPHRKHPVTRGTECISTRFATGSWDGPLSRARGPHASPYGSTPYIYPKTQGLGFEKPRSKNKSCRVSRGQKSLGEVMGPMTGRLEGVSGSHPGRATDQTRTWPGGGDSGCPSEPTRSQPHVRGWMSWVAEMSPLPVQAAGPGRGKRKPQGTLAQAHWWVLSHTAPGCSGCFYVGNTASS